MGIVITIVVVGSASYYYILPLVYGAGSAGGSSGRPDPKTSSGGDCPEIAPGAEAIATVPATPSVEGAVEAASSSRNVDIPDDLIKKTIDLVIPMVQRHSEGPNSSTRDFFIMLGSKVADLFEAENFTELKDNSVSPDEYKSFIMKIITFIIENSR